MWVWIDRAQGLRLAPFNPELFSNISRILRPWISVLVPPLRLCLAPDGAAEGKAVSAPVAIPM